jgi:hypothetical protein
VLDRVFGELHISNAVLQSITSFLLPSTQVWTDPFGGLMSLGQTLITTALIAMGAAALLSSTVTSSGSAARTPGSRSESNGSATWYARIDPGTFRTVKLFAKSARMVEPNDGDPPCTAHFSSRSLLSVYSPAAPAT